MPVWIDYFAVTRHYSMWPLVPLCWASANSTRGFSKSKWIHRQLYHFPAYMYLILRVIFGWVGTQTVDFLRVRRVGLDWSINVLVSVTGKPTPCQTMPGYGFWHK